MTRQKRADFNTPKNKPDIRAWYDTDAAMQSASNVENSTTVFEFRSIYKASEYKMATIVRLNKQLQGRVWLTDDEWRVYLTELYMKLKKTNSGACVLPGVATKLNLDVKSIEAILDRVSMVMSLRDLLYLPARPEVPQRFTILANEINEMQRRIIEERTKPKQQPKPDIQYKREKRFSRNVA